MIKESRHEFGFEEARLSGGSVFETGVKESKNNRDIQQIQFSFL